ncbi:MAG: TIGR02996 domain-containing protein [Deltaproteobacteria bacterium]|nr:TIGR02996 domain-containing protein [Deltaproteobacteria bacterium]
MDERDLIAAVAEAPDDDAPRLVYADWLMERGDPRGELVALQCALARADAADELLPWSTNASTPRRRRWPSA